MICEGWSQAERTLISNPLPISPNSRMNPEAWWSQYYQLNIYKSLVSSPNFIKLSGNVLAARKKIFIKLFG